jgi:putative transposase
VATLAPRPQAYLTEEAGQNLRSPKARTWSRCEHTPVVTVCGKGSGRVSVAGLVCLRPDVRSRLFYQMHVHRGHKGEHRSLSVETRPQPFNLCRPSSLIRSFT